MSLKTPKYPHLVISFFLCCILLQPSHLYAQEKAGAANKKSVAAGANNINRERILINEGWKFYKYNSIADSLIYDLRPEVREDNDARPADARPTEAVAVAATKTVLKPWILPTGNAILKDPAKRHTRPEGNPGGNFPFVQSGFNDAYWESVNLPHDWVIKEPFCKGWHTEIGGGMGSLPIQGVAWYRKKLEIPAADAGKSVFLDVDGA